MDKKGKGKEKSTEISVACDYHESSVHDTALKADIMRAYERFKVSVDLSMQAYRVSEPTLSSRMDLLHLSFKVWGNRLLNYNWNDFGQSGHGPGILKKDFNSGITSVYSIPLHCIVHSVIFRCSPSLVASLDPSAFG
jgi:hypothetical protein